MSSYEQHRKQARERQAAIARQGQELPEIPPVADPARRARCSDSFRDFCEVYFAEAFYLGWSVDHLKIIEKIETAVKKGGLFALAMPRGSGKTTLCQAAVTWAALTGRSPFITLIAASAERARCLLDNIKVWIETNDLLFADFPEVCLPVRALERIVNRQKGQRYNGTPTRIEWLADRIVLPEIEGSAASGTVVSCAGLKGGNIRGQHFARPDGKVIRPSLALIDDPQTTESAWSVSQSKRREAILAGDVLGMAGPGRKIAGLMTCTVIRRGDMADAILDRKEYPEWQGERVQMVRSFPSNESLWSKYADIRADEFLNDGDGAISTEFYRENREAMDAGAVVSWTERYNDDELSAIQHAMNLKLRDEEAFFAEYQNEPKVQEEEALIPPPEVIAGKVSNLPRYRVPDYASHLVGFIDVHDKALFYCVAAFAEDFTGTVVDYGVYPSQGARRFTLRDARKTLADTYKGAGVEGRVFSGVRDLIKMLNDQDYKRPNGIAVPIDRILIDANWGQTTEVVYQAARAFGGGKVFPSHGKFVGAVSRPFSDYKKRPGERVGRHWRSPLPTGQRGGIRHFVTDVNFWKSFLFARLAATPGDPGSVTLFGSNPRAHSLFSEHLTAEAPIMVEAAGRRVEEWKIVSAGRDNHWLDCAVGCCIAASIEGCELPEMVTAAKEKTRGRISFSAMQKNKNAQK